MSSCDCSFSQVKVFPFPSIFEHIHCCFFTWSRPHAVWSRPAWFFFFLQFQEADATWLTLTVSLSLSLTHSMCAYTQACKHTHIHTHTGWMNQIGWRSAASCRWWEPCLRVCLTPVTVVCSAMKVWNWLTTYYVVWLACLSFGLFLVIAYIRGLPLNLNKLKEKVNKT